MLAYTPRNLLGPLQSGARLGRYEIVAPLGAGGMGEVYRARDGTLNRDVAVEVVFASVANDPDDASAPTTVDRQRELPALMLGAGRRADAPS